MVKLNRVKEILARLEQKEEQLYQRAVKQVDKLLDRYDRQQPVVVILDCRTPQSVIKRVLDKYSKPDYGWSVREVKEQDLLETNLSYHDLGGITLEFSEPGMTYPLQITKSSWPNKRFKKPYRQAPIATSVD